jgi:hypothetical protein
MARKQPPQPQSRVLSNADLESAIRTIGRRIADLRSFEVSQIQERWDPRVQALETKVKASLAEIFGENTPEYRRHSIGMLDKLPTSIVPGHGFSPQRIQASIKEGIEGAVVSLGVRT